MGTTYQTYHPDPSGKPSMDVGLKNISHGYSVLGHFLNNRRKYNIEYAIFNRRIYSANRGWTSGSPYNRRAPGDWEHKQHVHTTHYASGTRYARPGMAWVGEYEPELVRFRGGEQVFNQRQIAAGEHLGGDHYELSGNFGYDPRQIIDELERRARKARTRANLGGVR
jgi:hypothetical protein